MPFSILRGVLLDELLLCPILEMVQQRLEFLGRGAFDVIFCRLELVCQEDFFSRLIPSWRLFDHDSSVLARKTGSDEYMLSEYVYSHISVFIA